MPNSGKWEGSYEQKCGAVRECYECLINNNNNNNNDVTEWYGELGPMMQL